MRELSFNEIEQISGGGSAWDDFWYNVGYKLVEFVQDSAQADDVQYEDPFGAGTTGSIPVTA
ncbi:MAG: hypothetical protein RKE49_01820 [Oceanicaulis sp.]